MPYQAVMKLQASSPSCELEEPDDEAGTEDTASVGLPVLEKRMKTVIHNEPIGKSEWVIIMNRDCQSHLMRRRRWFLGKSSTDISSAAHLPRLSLPAMINDWIYGRKEETHYRVLAGKSERRNNCE